MTADRHAKYVPSAPLEAPPDLAALVAVHLACEPGREWGRSLIRIQRWTYEHRARINQTYVIGEHYLTLSDSLPKIGKRGESNNNEERWR